MLCWIWGPNEAENTPGSRLPGQLGGEESEQYRALFFLNAKRRRFDKNRDFFANFQFSPLNFGFVQSHPYLTIKLSISSIWPPDFVNCSPYTYASFPIWSLVSDFFN
jgi:hypothetical protein